MPLQRRRRLPPEEAAAFERILERLTREEREALAKIYDLTGIRMEEFFSTLVKMSEEDRGVLPNVIQKLIKREPMTDKERKVRYEYSEFIGKLLAAPVLAEIPRKLTPSQLLILARYAHEAPEKFAPPAQPPPPKRPEAPPLKPPEKPRRVWRSWKPFRTSTFIKAYLKAKGEATPYETYRAFVYALTRIIRDEEFRKKVAEAKGIKVDGTMDHELTSKLAAEEVLLKAEWEEGLPTKVLPFIHKSSYNNFRRYFYMLETLGLIERVGDREWDVRRAHFKQKYRIVKGRENDPAWKKPQLYLYPLAWIGGKRYEILLNDAAMNCGINVEDLRELPYEERMRCIIDTIILSDVWQERLKLKDVARYWKMSVEDLLLKMYYQKYQPIKLLKERAERAEKIGEEKARVLREKIERREEIERMEEEERGK